MVKGWVLVNYWYLKDRGLAKNIESEILKVLRNKFPDSYLTKKDMPQNGYTEAFNSQAISSKKVISIINKEIKKII
jgi:hypothetical protein